MTIPTPSSHDGTFDSVTPQRICLPVYPPALFAATTPPNAKPELYMTPLDLRCGNDNDPFGYEPVAPRCARYTQDKGDLETTSYKTPTRLTSLLMAVRMDNAAPTIPDLSNLQSSHFFNRPLLLPLVSGASPCRPSLRPRWEARGGKTKRAIVRDSGLLLARHDAEDDPAPKAASIINSRLPTLPDSSTLDNEKLPALKPRRSHANPFVQY